MRGPLFAFPGGVGVACVFFHTRPKKIWQRSSEAGNEDKKMEVDCFLSKAYTEVANKTKNLHV